MKYYCFDIFKSSLLEKKTNIKNLILNWQYTAFLRIYIYFKIMQKKKNRNLIDIDVQVIQTNMLALLSQNS